MENNALTKNRVIAELTKSPHGDLTQYLPVGQKATSEDPAFFSHLLAWNQSRGQIRDAKVALPVIALMNDKIAEDAELSGNALACMAKLSPRDLLRSIRFSMGVGIRRRARLKPMVAAYLKSAQNTRGKFERMVVQHRGSLRELHALMHIKPEQAARDLLFDGKLTGIVASLRSLATLDAAGVAGTIERDRLPFLPVMGALGVRAKEPDILRAVIGSMSPTELVTNSKTLERLGVNSNPVLRAAYEQALGKVSTSSAAVLKTTKAAEAVGGQVGEQLKGAQERQLANMAVDGDWLVFADVSGSMKHSIEPARQIAAFLAKMAKGAVNLIFFNTTPLHFDVTGKSLEEITALTKRVDAMGGTAPGCAMGFARAKSLPADGIVIVGDGNENQAPRFAPEFKAFCQESGKTLPVYFYQLKGDDPNLLRELPREDIDVQVFDLRDGVDFYSLPALLTTMRTNRYSLVDEIMQTPLLRLGDVLKHAA